MEPAENEIQPSEVYYCDEIMKVLRSGPLLLDSADFKDSREAITLLQQISGVINRGIAEKHMQNTPHLVLLNQLFYVRELKPLMRLLYLRNKRRRQVFTLILDQRDNQGQASRFCC